MPQKSELDNCVGRSSKTHHGDVRSRSKEYDGLSSRQSESFPMEAVAFEIRQLGLCVRRECCEEVRQCCQRLQDSVRQELQLVTDSLLRDSRCAVGDKRRPENRLRATAVEASELSVVGDLPMRPGCAGTLRPRCRPSSAGATLAKATVRVPPSRPAYPEKERQAFAPADPPPMLQVQAPSCLQELDSLPGACGTAGETAGAATLAVDRPRAPQEGPPSRSRRKIQSDADVAAGGYPSLRPNRPRLDATKTRLRPHQSRLSITREMAKSAATSKKAQKTFWQMNLTERIQSPLFDNVVGCVILLNALIIGVQTDITAKDLIDEPSIEFVVFEHIFCAWFTAELALRLWVRRCSFFQPFHPGWLWNYFDLSVVAAQLVEVAFDLVARSSSFDVSRIRLLRVMRILRLVRILRVVRVLHLIGELRAIVSSIVGSFRSLLWVVVLLLLMIYIVAVYFTQSITDHMLEQRGTNDWEPTDEEDTLRHYFGSLSRAILSLWQAMSGGMDWDTLAQPLLQEISVFTGLAFASYIAFALLALMNVVTGVFVQTALQSARNEEDTFITQQIVNLFHMADTNGSRLLSIEEIEDSLVDPKCIKEWKSVGVTAEDARYLFCLLDVDGSGEVAFEEFLGGCLRLTGPAKALDVLTVMQEARRSEDRRRRDLDALTSSVEDLLEKIRLQIDTADIGSLVSCVGHLVGSWQEERAELRGLTDFLTAALHDVKLGLAPLSDLVAMISDTSQPEEGAEEGEAPNGSLV